MPKDKHESSAEFAIIIQKLDEIQAIKTDVKLLEQNQKHFEKNQDDMKVDINDLFTRKSSKEDVKTVATSLAKHIEGHFLLFLAVVGSMITGAWGLFLAWNNKG